MDIRVRAKASRGTFARIFFFVFGPRKRKRGGLDLGGRFWVRENRAVARRDAPRRDGLCDHRYLRRGDFFRGERARVARGTRSRLVFFFCLSFACSLEGSLSLFCIIVKKQPSQKTFKIKKILGKKQKQNRPIPQWIRMKTGNTIRYNAKRRHWRRTKLNI